MQDVIREKKDLRYLKWTKTRQSSGTAGSFLKSYEVIKGKKRYYKLSDYDKVLGIVGHECVNEIIAQRLMDHIGIEHLSYTLCHADITVDNRDCETWLCFSDDFKKPRESKLSIEDYYQQNGRDGESPLDMIIRLGWEQEAFHALYIDYLIDNRDRHGANMEILRSADKKSYRMAPLFDQGLSLVCRCHSVGELSDFDVMADRRVQSFLGTGSTKDNLNLIKKQSLKRYIKKGLPERDALFTDLYGILEDAYYDRIWEMITKRYEYVKSI